MTDFVVRVDIVKKGEFATWAIESSGVSNMIGDRWTELPVAPSTTEATSPEMGDVARTPQRLADGGGQVSIPSTNFLDYRANHVPTNPQGAAADIGRVDAVQLRAALGRWFGYAPRWGHSVNEVVGALEERRSLAISAPRGAAVDELTYLLEARVSRLICLRSDSGDPAAAVKDVTGHESVTVIAEGLHADDLFGAALLASGCAVVRIPAIAERRGDLARLLGEARSRAEVHLGVEANISGDMRALYAHSWPGHLDEIDRIVPMVVALRATKSLRRAAQMLEMRKSTLATHLHAVGIHTARSGD